VTNPAIPAAEWDIAAMTSCATALRRDWDAQETTGALIAAQHRGWTATHALIVLARRLARPDSSPRDLLAAAAHPCRRSTQPARPEVRDLLAGAARAAITPPRPGHAA
jgi:hypothetical protein